MELGCFILSPAYLIQLNYYYRKMYLKLVSKLAMGFWSSGICDLDSCTCCYSCVCPCLVIYWNVKNMDMARFPEIPCVDKCGCLDRPKLAACMYAIGFSGVVLSCCAYIPILNVLGILSVCTHCNIRHMIRENQQIRSDYCCCCEDMWCALWCYSCAITQEYKQLKEISSQNTTAPKNSMMASTEIRPEDVKQQTRP